MAALAAREPGMPDASHGMPVDKALFTHTPPLHFILREFCAASLGEFHREQQQPCFSLICING
jgi:hypothetical protein